MSDPLPPLSAEDKSWLLALARRSVEARVGGRPGPDLSGAPEGLCRGQGAFVTLKHEDELRGCIGRIDWSMPLCEVVRECAGAAAAEDPRFQPVAREEVSALTIEISALSPPSVARDRSRIEIGRHGLIVSRGPWRGVLLPQVAVEQGWDAAAFVKQTCLKAGLPPDACERGALLEVFEAEVFSETAPDRPSPDRRD